MTGDPFAEEAPSLLQHHFDMLHEGSGLPVDIITERGYRSVLGPTVLQTLGFSPSQRRTPGILLPVYGPDGRNGLYTYRPDHPRQDRRGKVCKYEMPANALLRLDVPPRCRKDIDDPRVPLWLTEGQKKADALAARGLCAAALLGVWNFRGTNEKGGSTLLADFHQVALNAGRQVRIVFDSDVMHKPQVKRALNDLTAIFQGKGAIVAPVYLPDGPDGQKVGVDDYLLTHTLDDLNALVTQPKPEPRPAAPAVELLDAAPPSLTRPLALVDGVAYAATWLWVKETQTETTTKQGEVVRLDPPRVTTEQRLFIVRSEGRVYGPGGTHAMDDLGVEVKLPEPVREGRGWRVAGVRAYRDGKRPDPARVFNRLEAIYNHFIDFNRSLAGQEVMCKLAACLSLMTWFTPALQVLGYPWPNGERGSGKTNLGLIWARTSFLGEVVLAGGSFAALRDLADYGATLLFDDAENLGDPKRTDPDKRALLLAGNRRGARIPLKEQQPDGTWATRWVDAFCPRGFTAIKLPDPVLASRVIILPLVRTSDAKRGNADPADTKRWPCDYAMLQDDLWALALWLLPEAEGVWAELDDETELIGREFEPWRAVLTIARLLERHGVAGLEETMRGVMRAYKEEKADLVTTDRTMLVVRALLDVATRDTNDAADADDTTRVTLTASQLKPVIESYVKEGEGESADWITTTWIGRILSQLRIKPDRKATSRLRVTTRGEVRALARAYGLLARQDDAGQGEDDTTTEDATPLPDSVISVSAVISVTPEEPVADAPTRVRRAY